LAARERKCSSRVIIGLVLIDFGYCSRDPFNRAKAGVGAEERAGLISERAATKTLEDGILMTVYVAAPQRSNLRSSAMSWWNTSITMERMLATEDTL
jgi:hypothetical protein